MLSPAPMQSMPDQNKNTASAKASSHSATVLEFEKPVFELEKKIFELRNLSSKDEVNIIEEIERLETKVQQHLKIIYQDLSPWQTVQVARHADRPRALSYISGMIEQFLVLSGDRTFGDDQSIIGGTGWLRGIPVMVIAQEKGVTTEERLKRNFGMSYPEGYRKAKRLMQLADRFGLPIITLVDTPGAYPGLGAEERGQAEAIASSIATQLSAHVPIISVVIGEGGSGGAIALASGDRCLMLEHSIYSVITPEGCASILWRDAKEAAQAAVALKLTARDLLGLGVIDGIIPEPLGGAHRNAAETVRSVGDELEKQLRALVSMEGEELKTKRRERFLAFRADRL